MTTATPLERLIVFSLRETPNQTIQQLKQTTGAKTDSYLRRTLRLLTLTGQIVQSGDGTTATYATNFATEVN